jgi:hypothetical protein
MPNVPFAKQQQQMTASATIGAAVDAHRALIQIKPMCLITTNCDMRRAGSRQVCAVAYLLLYSIWVYSSSREIGIGTKVGYLVEYPTQASCAGLEGVVGDRWQWMELARQISLVHRHQVFYHMQK